MAAGHHYGVDTPGAHWRRHFHMIERIDAAMSEEQPGAGELAASHPQSALVEIGSQYVGHGTMEIAEGTQEVGEAGVAKTGLFLGVRDLRIDRHRGIIGL